MLKAVVFDYGGVVSAFEIQHVERALVDKIADTFGVHPETFAGEILKVADQFQRGKIDEAAFWQNLSSVIGKPLPDISGWHWGEPESLKPQPQIVELVGELKSKGIKTAMLSNAFPTIAAQIREIHGYAGFDPIILACDTGYMKPEPEAYKITLDRLGEKPENCLMVDDRVEFLLPAAKLGMQTLEDTGWQEVVDNVRAMIAE